MTDPSNPSAEQGAGKMIETYTAERRTVERRTIIGPMPESKDVMSALHYLGWWLVRTGPYTDKKMYPKVDVSRFQFIAEREIPKGGSHAR